MFHRWNLLIRFPRITKNIYFILLNGTKNREAYIAFLNYGVYHCTGRQADESRNPVLRQAVKRCASH